ncbi:MAG: metallophosphoesterase [Oscillospiraceae bacterium]|nr:metallophosphoesterase [Oscillospiraceae bacterium]
MKLLLIADWENPALWDYYLPGKLDGIDLIISCGDLDAEYLSFLVTMGRAPVLYVHGNHDGRYEVKPPEGCDCIEDDLVVVKGLRILGLGGSMLYSGGAHQYSELQMTLRVAKLSWKLLRHKGVDIVVTHAPVQGCGDGADLAHRGFRCFQTLLDRVRPRYWVHGHVHLNYGRNPRICVRGNTTVINAYGSYILEL